MKHCVGLVIAMAVTTVVWAQGPGAPPPGGGRGPMISIADMEAAWALEAAHAATKLGLSTGQASRLQSAYTNVRREHGKHMMEAMRQGERPPREGRDGFRDARRERDEQVGQARVQLQQSLNEFLSAEQVSQVMRRLGTFNPQFDAMANAIRGFNLGANQDQALELSNTFVVETHELAESARASGDFQAVRGQFETKRATLDNAMATLLTPEQMNAWRDATEMRRGGPDGPGGPGGPGERRGPRGPGQDGPRHDGPPPQGPPPQR